MHVTGAIDESDDHFQNGGPGLLVNSVTVAAFMLCSLLLSTRVVPMPWYPLGSSLPTPTLVEIYNNNNYNVVYCKIPLLVVLSKLGVVLEGT